MIEKGQVKSDPEKVKAAIEWPVPSSRKQLQRLSAFANFYRRFIQNESHVAAHLPELTSVK